MSINDDRIFILGSLWNISAGAIWAKETQFMKHYIAINLLKCKIVRISMCRWYPYSSTCCSCMSIAFKWLTMMTTNLTTLTYMDGWKLAYCLYYFCLIFIWQSSMLIQIQPLTHPWPEKKYLNQPLHPTRLAGLPRNTFAEHQKRQYLIVSRNLVLTSVIKYAEDWGLCMEPESDSL